MNTVSQLSPNPTNKLTAAMVATFFVEILKLLIKNAWPQYYDDALFVALSPLAIILAGYFIKDAPNTQVTVTTNGPA